MFETKLTLLKYDVIYYFEPYVLARWSVLVDVSVDVSVYPLMKDLYWVAVQKIG